MKKTSEMLAKSAIRGLSDVAPLIVLFITLLSFALLGIIEYNYYADHILRGNITHWGLVLFIAGGVAAFVQLLRSGLVLMSIRDFSADRDGRGFFGLLFSFGATLYCTFEISHLAEAWSGGDPTLSTWIGTVLYFVNWAGFALEVRIALSVSADEAPETESTAGVLTASEYASYRAIKEDQPAPSSNGIHNQSEVPARTVMHGFRRPAEPEQPDEVKPEIATAAPIIATENLERVIDAVADKYRRGYLKQKLALLKAYQNNLKTRNGRPERINWHIQNILTEIEEELRLLREDALQTSEA